MFVVDGEGGGDGDFVSEGSSDEPWQSAQPTHSVLEHMYCCSDEDMPAQVHVDAQPDGSSAVEDGGGDGTLGSQLNSGGGDGGGVGSRS